MAQGLAALLSTEAMKPDQIVRRSEPDRMSKQNPKCGKLERLFAFLVLGHGRRQLLWFEATAEWLVRQITKAFP